MSPDKLVVPPERVSNHQLFAMLQTVSAKQSLQLVKYDELAAKMTQLDKDTREMRDAWMTLGRVLKFIKVLSVTIGAVTVVYYSLSSLLKSLAEAIRP